MRIYTKTGDSGETDLFDGQRVAKSDSRIELMGSIDETNAWVGVALAHLNTDDVLDKWLVEVLVQVQRRLFVAGGDVAAPKESTPWDVPRIDADDTLWCETTIDHCSTQLPELRAFILPGGTPCAAALHGARTVIRRAERIAVATLTLAEYEHLLVFLNRCSDLFFTLARMANFIAGEQDIEWSAAQRR
jgi:cob(I)alamin adenosyltransferase